AEILSRRLRAAKVSICPWRGLGGARYQVVVAITRFDGPAGGDTLLEARWRILDGATAKELAGKTTRLTEAAGGAGYPQTVSAMSRALAGLSRDIAQALISLPQ